MTKNVKYFLIKSFAVLGKSVTSRKDKVTLEGEGAHS